MENKPKFRPYQNLRLMDQVREVLRYHRYAYRTEQTCCQWTISTTSAAKRTCASAGGKVLDERR